MRYYLYVKSHTEALDYEDEINAKNLQEAYDEFLKTQPGLSEWDKEDILKHIHADYLDFPIYNMISSVSLVPVVKGVSTIVLSKIEKYSYERLEQRSKVLKECFNLLDKNEKLDVDAMVHYYQKDRETLMLSIKFLINKIKKKLKENEKNKFK